MQILRTDFKGRGKWKIVALALNAIGRLANDIVGENGIEVEHRGGRLVISNQFTPGSNFPWALLAFGWSLAYDADAEETTCTIRPGKVIMHHIRTYTLAAEADVVLSGATAIVHMVMDRMSSSSDIVIACDAVAESTGSQMKIPLYTYIHKGLGRYALSEIHNMGDVNFSAPIR